MNTRDRVREAFFRTGGNLSATARSLGLSRGTVQYHVRKMRGNLPDKPLSSGVLHAGAPTKRGLPPRGTVARYILSSAQSSTRVNDAVMDSLEAMARHYEAEILISRFTYNRAAYSSMDVKPERGPNEEDLSMWFDPRIESYVCDSRVQLAPGLVFCGEVNIMPTAARPLSGFETYTGTQSGIFPHVKFALDSIPTANLDPTKFNLTTGTVTLRNYIQKKAGQKAEHHHCYGALLVEVCSDGTWFCRQLNSTERGEIYDLDVRAWEGVVTTGNPVEAITWGDVHAAQIDSGVATICWGEGGMLDTLAPRRQFCHDIFDMRSRNHHETRNPHSMFRRFIEGEESVEGEVAATAKLMSTINRPWCETVIVNSNHDNALERWLREADYRENPVNALFFLEAQLAKYRSMADRDSDFMLLEWAMDRAMGGATGWRWLRQDESYIICSDAHGGIECGMHGHLGPNGSKGTPLGLSRMGRKANTGHTHSAAIIDGMYVAGCSAKLDMGYNSGPSSWSHSHIVTYSNGKRAIVTISGGRWRG